MPVVPPPELSKANTLFRLQLAMAIAVLRSKPERSTPREHVLQLRTKLVNKNRAVVKEQPRRHLDRIAYWKERCEDAERRIEALEYQNTKLQRSYDALQLRPEIDDCISAPNTPDAKRKRAGCKSSGQAKRLKVSPQETSLPPQGRPSTCASLMHDLSLLDGEGHAAAVLTQHLYTLHALHRQQDADPQSLCFTLIKIANAIGSMGIVITKYIKKEIYDTSITSLANERENSPISSIISVCARAFASLLVGLRRLNGNADRALSVLVIYECIGMGSCLLDQIREIADTTAVARSASTSKTKDSSKVKLNAQSDNSVGVLAQLLYDFISYLDKNDVNQREIFEGWLFVLLERVGDRLFYCTFGFRRASTVADDMKVPPSREQRHRKANPEDQTIRVEVRALIILLRRAIALAPYHLNPRPASVSRKASSYLRTPTSRSLALPSKAPLIAQAKDRLQRTLISCMFGEEDCDELSNVLRKPARSGRVPKEPNFTDANVSEWFQEEVWKLVGWDLLSKCEEW